MLQGKTALITGAAKGIGAAIALEMAKNGAAVAINYLGASAAAEELKQAILNLNVRCGLYPCDVADFALSKRMIDAVISDFGRVDILVNNAGITRDNLIIRMTEDDFDRVMAVNLKGAFHTIKHLCPHFIKNRYGRIINVTSVVGLTGQAGQFNYAASKGALIAATKSAAKELAGRGITCNAIAPGFIETDMTAKLPDEVVRRYLDMIPLKRAGQPSDVAKLAAFLAGDGAAYITGEVIKADGGLCI